MKRWWLLLGSSALLAMLLGGAGWLLGTEAGLRAVLARAPLAHGAVRGSLAGGFEVEALRLARGRFQAEAALVAGDLEPLPLLVGKLHLARLEVVGLRATLAPDPDPQPVVLPERLAPPLPIAIDALVLREARLAVGGAAPLTIASASSVASADARGFRLTELMFEAAPLSARGSLALGAVRPFPVEGALKLGVARAAGAPVAGRIELGGRLEELVARVASDAPLATRATLTLTDPFVTRRLDGELRAFGLDLAALHPPLGAARLDADLSLAGPLAALGIRGGLALRRADEPELRATLDATLTGTDLTLRRAELALVGHPTRATVGGRIALPAPQRYALSASVTDFRLSASGPVLVPRASLAIEGDGAQARVELAAEDGRGGTLTGRALLGPAAASARLAAPRWTLADGTVLDDAALEVVRDGDGRLRATLTSDVARGALQGELSAAATLTGDRLEVDQLALATLDGRIEGTASATLRPTLAWRATLAGRDLDPAGLEARLPGRIGFRAALAGGVQEARLSLTELGGVLRGLPLAGDARLAWRAAGRPALGVERLHATLGTTTLDAQHDATTSRLALDAPDLAPLWPALRGRLALRATRADGGWQGTLEGAGLALGTRRIGALHATLEAPAAGEQRASLVAQALVDSELALDRLSLEASGPRAALAVTLEAQHQGWRARAVARGALRGARFEGALGELGVTPDAGPAWTLAAPAALGFGGDGLSLGASCVIGSAARVCVEGAWRPRAAWRATSTVVALPLGALRALLPRGLEYRGRLDLDGELAGTGTALARAHAVLQLSSGAIVPSAARDAARRAPEPPLLEWSGGRIALDEGAGGLATQVALELAGHGALSAELRATGGGPLAQRPLAGKLSAHADRFALLPVLLPELKDLAGTLRAELALAGTLAAPRFAGELGFHDGRAKLPRYGIEVEGVELTAKGDGDALRVAGSARGGGTLAWRFDLARRDGEWQAEGWIKGERFRALDTPEARVIASPDLTLSLRGRDVALRGGIAVPEARIAPRSLATATLASADEVLVGSVQPPRAERGLQVDARLRLAFGPRVRFEGFGLAAGVSGELTVVERPGALTLASGELMLSDGVYQAYGQELSIARGRLLFSGGPAADPGLDVRAQRSIERVEGDVTVGIGVRGTLRRPETTLFSTPSLSSSEQLAYLVLGHPLTESTEGEQQTLGDAAAAMRLSGGEYLAQQIGRRLGLDEVRVTDASDQSEAQLWLGTYLSPRLFVSYGVGLFEQFYTARVRYQISSKWTMEAESGRESSADFKYTIER